MWIEKVLPPCWENLQSCWESYRTQRRHSKSVEVLTIDNRRVVTIDTACEQWNEEIEIQTQDA